MTRIKVDTQIFKNFYFFLHNCFYLQSKCWYETYFYSLWCPNSSYASKICRRYLQAVKFCVRLQYLNRGKNTHFKLKASSVLTHFISDMLPENNSFVYYDWKGQAAWDNKATDWQRVKMTPLTGVTAISFECHSSTVGRYQLTLQKEWQTAAGVKCFVRTVRNRLLEGNESNHV